jgi:hypothetical protein
VRTTDAEPVPTDRGVPTPRSPVAGVAVFMVGLALLVVVLSLPALTRPADPGDDRVRNTIRLSLAWYAVAAGLMLCLRPGEWMGQGRGRLARAAWTWAWAVYVVHVGLAFHFAHGWSHAHAVETTRARSGVGEGIYVSHLFTLLWTLDVAWWWLRPVGYAVRAPWIDGLLHGFMVFVIFNGTVVFASGPVRWAALGGFALLAWLLCRRLSALAAAPPSSAPAAPTPTG